MNRRTPARHPTRGVSSSQLTQSSKPSTINKKMIKKQKNHALNKQSHRGVKTTSRKLTSPSGPKRNNKFNTTQHANITIAHIEKYRKPAVPPVVSFTDHANAYRSKTTPELIFTNAIFASCRIKPLVKYAPQLIKLTRMTLGDNFLEFFVKQTYYKHFCAGKDEVEITPTITKIASDGIGSILDYGAEPEDDSMGPSTSSASSSAVAPVEDKPVPKVIVPIEQHGHSHNGVPCGHNHNQAKAESAIDNHIKAHEDLHNVFAFANTKKVEAKNDDMGMFDFAKTTPNDSELVTSAGSTKSSLSKVGVEQQALVTRGNKPRRYDFKDEKHFDAETLLFKRSIDASYKTKQAIQKVLTEALINEATPHGTQLKQRKSMGVDGNYSQEQLANFQKVLEEPGFIAIKITAMASTTFLTRASSLINFHGYMWDVMKGKDEAELHYTKQRLVDDAKPTDDEFISATPSFVDDQYDTLTREQFSKAFGQYYDLTMDDTNELFDFCTTDRNKTTISRHDWQSNMNLHHLLSLSNKLIPSALPPRPKNYKDLLFHYPEVDAADKGTNTWIDREDIDHLNRVMQRLDDVCKHAQANGGSIFVDAEQTYYQQAVDHITMDLMATYNSPMAADYYRHVPQIEKPLMKKNTTTDESDVTTTTTTATTPKKSLTLTTTTTTTPEPTTPTPAPSIPQNLLAAKKWHHDYDMSAMEAPTPLVPSGLARYFETPQSTSSAIDLTVPIPRHPVVWHTYQCYLKDTLYRVKRDFNLAQDHNFTFACKLVRGAYIQAETERAEQMDYTNPLNPGIEATHESYNKAMLYMLSQRNLNSANPAHVLIASHNQETFEIATNYLDEELTRTTIDLVPSDSENAEEEEAKNQPLFALAKPSNQNPFDSNSSSNPKNNKKKTKQLLPKHKLRVYFAQLYGMGQRLTYPLANNGYGAFNYVTYGPPIMCLPYLLRRAQENGSMLGGTVVESKLISKEVKRRLTGGEKK